MVGSRHTLTLGYSEILTFADTLRNTYSHPQKHRHSQARVFTGMLTQRYTHTHTHTHTYDGHLAVLWRVLSWDVLVPVGLGQITT